MKKIWMIKDNSAFCSVPFTQLQWSPADVRPCCKFGKSINQDSVNINEIWYGVEMQKLREDVLSNKFNEHCSKCDVGPDEFSYAKFKNDGFKSLLVDIDADNLGLPRALNVALSNTCNLACRMCHVNNSSKLAHIATETLSKYVGSSPTRTNVDEFLDAQAPYFQELIHLTLSGGEPFYDKNCLRLIELLAEHAPKLRTVNMSTNMTVLSKRMLEVLSKMNAKVTFSVSLDGPPHINDYIREFSSWSKIEKNLRHINEAYPNRFEFHVNSTLSALNVGHVAETLQTFDKLQDDLNISFGHIMASPVLESHMHAGVLPQEVKQDYLRKLEAAKSNITGAIEMISSAKALIEIDLQSYGQFKEFIQEFDRITGKDFASIYGWTL